MSASHSLNNHLFDRAFQHFRGMTLDQAVRGYTYSGGKLYSPEESDEIDREMDEFRRKRGKDVPFRPPAAERASEIAGQHRPIEHIVNDWAMNHRTLMVGTNTVGIARDLLDLGREIKSNSRTPEVKLYRGATVSPQEQVKSAPDLPLSFTEDPHVARSFAKSGSKGTIFHALPGSVRGIYVPDYVKRQRTVGQGRREEREWLVDPASIQ